MGISIKTEQELQKFTDYRNKKLRIAELGDQVLRPWGASWYSSNCRCAKFWFEKFGCFYRSFDVNGNNHSNRCDFRIELTDDFKKKFEFGSYDVATDYGTLEHVENMHYNAWKFIHELPKEDGLIHHILPNNYHVAEHGEFFFQIDFFKELAKISNYEILSLYEENHDLYPEGYIWCMFKKTTSDFCTKEQFDEIWEKYVTYKNVPRLQK